MFKKNPGFAELRGSQNPKPGFAKLRGYATPKPGFSKTKTGVPPHLNRGSLKPGCASVAYMGVTRADTCQRPTSGVSPPEMSPIADTR